MSTFNGIVQQGAKRGRGLGYPTINIPLEDATVTGVYAAIVRIDKTLYHAAAFADPSRKLLEAHLFGFAEEVYGRQATIELKDKIRDAQRFDDDDLLKKAIAEDVTQVRNYFEK